MPVNGEIFPHKKNTVHIDVKANNRLSLAALAFSVCMALVQSFSSKGSVFGPGLSADWQGNKQNQHGFERSGRLGRLSQNRASHCVSLLFLSYFSVI